MERGVYKGRTPMEIDENKFKTMCEEWKAGKRTATSIPVFRSNTRKSP